MFNRREKDLLGALQAVMSTEAGKKLFKYLKENYVEGSSIASSVEQTYYNLGKKELIQGLLLDSKLKESDLEPIQTIQSYED